MRRALWFLRSVIESVLGILLLVVAPELILMEIRGHDPLGFVLLSLLVASMMLVAGFFLFMDAVRIRMKLKGQVRTDPS